MEKIIFENTLEYFRWLREKKKLNIVKEDEKSNNETIHNEYHLWRWKIKKILIEEKIIERAFDWKTVLDVFDQVIIDILKDINLINKSEFKERLKSQRSLLIEHHTKYKEIHSVDESLWMTPSEHRNLHNLLRREEKCNVPPEELEKISLVATRRTEKHKEAIREYNKTEKFRKYKSEYCKAHIMRKRINITLEKNVRLYEEIVYNIKTGSLLIYSGFQYGRGKGFPTIYIG